METSDLMKTKSKKKTGVQYKDFYGQLRNATLAQMKAALQDELGRDTPRVDLVRRLISRINATRSRLATNALLALLSVDKSRRDVEATLSRNS